jgi:fructokinase
VKSLIKPAPVSEDPHQYGPHSSGHRRPPVLTVIGEALIDLVPHGEPGDYRARPGGSPFNVAIGLARLGHRTALMARLADNAFGRLLREHAAAEGVGLAHAPRATEPTTLAVVSLDAEAQAAYDFYLNGTADWQWSAAEAADLPPATAVLHLGSLASWTAPGHDRIHAAASELRRQDSVLISYDPNIRPLLLGDPAGARPLIERCVGVAHLVKASREDVAWLYPETELSQVARHWLTLGPQIVVVTDGPHGAHLFQPDAAALHRPGRRIRLVDTIGAGDAFTAGLLSGLVQRDLHAPKQLRQCPPDLLAAALDDAILVSALTCERVGADPPTAAELESLSRSGRGLPNDQPPRA